MIFRSMAANIDKLKCAQWVNLGCTNHFPAGDCLGNTAADLAPGSNSSQQFQVLGGQIVLHHGGGLVYEGIKPTKRGGPEGVQRVILQYE